MMLIYGIYLLNYYRNLNDRLPANNTTGHRNISWSARDKRYTVHLKVNQQIIPVGYYKTLEQAIVARDLAYKEYGYYTTVLK